MKLKAKSLLLSHVRRVYLPIKEKWILSFRQYEWNRCPPMVHIECSRARHSANQKDSITKEILTWWSDIHTEVSLIA